MENSILSETLVTGANGMVGSYIDFGIKTDKNVLDVTNITNVLSVVRKYRPKVILHLAAETDVDRCERDPARAYAINSVGTYHMTVAAKEIGAKLVYVSTAGVFDGEKKTPYTERDTPHPQNYYGHSKYLGELAVRGNLTDYLILRVCWMIGGGPAKDKKFVAKIINQLRDPLTTGIRAVTDQIGAPTFGKDFISAIKVLVQKGETGIFHLPNSGYASRYDVATFIAQKMKPEMKVMPVNSSYFNLEAKRTKNETLSSRLAIMRPWQEALEEYLRTEWGGSATSLSTPPV